LQQRRLPGLISGHSENSFAHGNDVHPILLADFAPAVANRELSVGRERTFAVPVTLHRLALAKRPASPNSLECLGATPSRNGSAMRATRILKLFSALCVCLAFAADAESAAGYKGIPWGTACPEAVKQMEAKGFVFDGKEKTGWRAEGTSPWQPHLFLPNRDRRTSCSMENADLEMETKQANPYVAFESMSGNIGIALLCRGGRFVGARLETALTNTSAAALLTRAAGVPVRTLRADTCGRLNWECTADHSLLRARGDAVRYLERPVRSSPEYTGQEPQTLRYLLLAQSEDRALQSAYLACAGKQLAGARLEEKRIQNGNRAAVE
jgi:hypothetical protein